LKDFQGFPKPQGPGSFKGLYRTWKWNKKFQNCQRLSKTCEKPAASITLLNYISL